MTDEGRTSTRDDPQRSGRVVRVWRPALVVLAVAVQAVVLYSPQEPSVGGLASVSGLDKVVHASVFCLVMVAARIAHLPRVPLLLLTVVQAPVSEIVQGTLFAHRTGDPWDVVADLVGCALGWWLTRERR